MISELIMGVIQGLAEWLPISSDGLLTVFSSEILNNPFLFSVQIALFLHLGTMLASVIFYRKEFLTAIKNPLSNLSKFLIISTFFSALAGGLSYFLLDYVSESLGQYSTLLVSAGLVLTAYIQKKAGLRKHFEEKALKFRHAVILGLAQGLAVLPGVSRSGLTVSSLLLFNFSTETALKVSFMMSVPAVLIANIFLGLNDFAFSINLLFGALSAFIVGLLTLKVLTQFAERIEFWKICIILAGLNLFTILF